MQTDFTGSDSPIHKIFEDFDLGVQASPSHSSRRFSGDSFDLEDSPSSLLDIEEVFFAPKSSSAPPVKSPLPRFEPSKSQKNVADMDLIPRESKDSFPQGPLDIVLGSAGKETAKRGKDNNEDLSSEDVREFSDERHQRHYNEMLMLASKSCILHHMNQTKLDRPSFHGTDDTLLEDEEASGVGEREEGKAEPRGKIIQWAKWIKRVRDLSNETGI
eukprot:TRINITY_DN662_c0_g1_i3.p1 TRINITY_DN662_c0_g1~~TRINITY_DN662_c0_g1_i3.p1  ORF type:complete len:216 (+),score=17.88 TRINITY_DN662_c0_g1_i3:256-903(+)